MTLAFNTQPPFFGLKTCECPATPSHVSRASAKQVLLQGGGALKSKLEAGVIKNPVSEVEQLELGELAGVDGAPPGVNGAAFGVIAATRVWSTETS